MQLNINSDAVVAFTNKLEKMHRSLLPAAIRETLSKTALNVKQKTMPKTAKDEFEDRTRGNFWKGNSSVEFAKGYDISNMKSTVGFLSTKLKGGKNHAVKDLEQQEHGGNIDGRSLIPLEKARVSNSFNRIPQKKYRISDIKNFVNSKDSNAKTDKAKWFSSVNHAGVGGFIISNKENGKGNRFVYEILKITKGLDTQAKVKPIFALKKDRQINVKPQKFMQKSALISATSMEKTFILEAQRQIQRIR